ncbi:hypothetical protein [Lacrimispora sp.]|jgi:hypothetical protein|uniref:hypothetical protein n=1 Tax=Lacrimispora sp. TaxID=2719234 RepID=UPI0028A1E48D|nr:hypothetical protein [Lacrimispora sp.]
MKKDDLKQIIADCCNDIVFSYNNVPSGITSEVENRIPTFQAWHGEDIKEYGSIDDVMNDPFYSGKSLNDLAESIEIDVV